MFAPGVPDLMVEFGSTSEELATFCVSVYVLGFAAGPMFFAPLSEIYGRSIIYNITNVGFIGRDFAMASFSLLFQEFRISTDMTSLTSQSSSSPAQKPLRSMPSSSSASSVASSAPSPSPSEAAASPT